MTQRWWLIIVLLLSLGLNLGFFASRVVQQRASRTADSGDAATEASAEDQVRRDGRMPRFVRRMADELDLEGERREAFIEIQRTFFEQTIDARGRMARLQDAIRREITSASPDRQVLDEMLTELSAAHRDLERAFVTNLLDSRELLDGDQERRFMRFLRRMRNVRADVEQRFRERWRRQGRQWPGDLRSRERRGIGRFGDRPLDPPQGEPPPASEPAEGDDPGGL